MQANANPQCIYWLYGAVAEAFTSHYLQCYRFVYHPLEINPVTMQELLQF